MTAKDVKLAIIDGGILHSLAALNLPTIRKVRMYVRNKSFIAFAYKIYECIVPVITKREILFFSSRFFSRTVLEFFWDSEEHDFHFSCWRDWHLQCTTSWKRHASTSGDFRTVPGDCSPKKSRIFFGLSLSYDRHNTSINFYYGIFYK